MDFRLDCNKTLAVVGPSHCGKTIFTLAFLDKRHEVFKQAINRVVWCYGIHQPSLIQQLRQRDFIIHDGILPVDEIQPNDIIVLDDLLNQSTNSKDVTDMFTRAAHHKPCFIIFIMQNLFPPGKEASTRSLNTYSYTIFNRTLTDAFRNTSKGIGATYAGKVPAGRIDYIFHDPLLGSKDFKIQEEELSDHYAISCTLFKKE